MVSGRRDRGLCSIFWQSWWKTQKSSCSKTSFFGMSRLFSSWTFINRITTKATWIGPKSWFLLQKFGINNEGLQWPVSKWPKHQTFNNIHCFVYTAKVVNDAAESGIKLNTNHATIHTDKGRQKSSLIEAVEKPWQDYPDFRKST